MNLPPSESLEADDDKAEQDGISNYNQLSDISHKISNNYSKFMSFIHEFGYGMIILSMMAR
mgnify:CR=1 FL=1